MLSPTFFAAEPESSPSAPEIIFRAGLRHHHIANTAYPIGHNTTFNQHRVPRANHEDLLRDSLAHADRLGLYLHIPFCERRCSYCEYTVVENAAEETQNTYLYALHADLRNQIDTLNLGGKPLVGLDIGGGTPSVVDPAKLAPLLTLVRDKFTLEKGFGISIETTPRIAANDKAKLQSLAALGIERISMGLQMVNSHLLDLYGRDYNGSGNNALAIENMRAAGFRKINLDLMYGFAKQSHEDFESSLRATIALAPDIITLYRMRYKGTRIVEEAGEVTLAAICDLYELARGILLSEGYHAPPGKNCFTRIPSDPGTSAYLTERVVSATPYLGLGLGAQSFSSNVLAYNQGAAGKLLSPYLRDTKAGILPIQDLYHLPKSEGLAKAIAVSFYFGQIDLPTIGARFETDIQAHFGREIEFVLNEGLMHYDGSILRLTSAGAKAFSGVISLFYSNTIKHHLLSL